MEEARIRFLIPVGSNKKWWQFWKKDKSKEAAKNIDRLMSETVFFHEQRINGGLRNATVRFCFNQCKYLSITESNQTMSHEPHICGRYNKQVLHNGAHPQLVMLDECDYDNSGQFEN